MRRWEASCRSSKLLANNTRGVAHYLDLYRADIDVDIDKQGKVSEVIKAISPATIVILDYEYSKPNHKMVDLVSSSLV